VAPEVARRLGLPHGAPPQVRALVGPGERVLAWCADPAGAPLVASTRALYLVGDGGARERLPYERVATATWQAPLLEVVTVGPARRRIVVRMDQPGRVPATVRDRVTASVVLSEHVALVGEAGAQITARRQPAPSASPGAEPDKVSWNVVFDPGVDPADPQVRTAADRAIEGLRATTGL
jgi:hypothetical protein